MANENRYELWVTQGQGTDGPDMYFDTLEEALAYVEKHDGEASFGIVYPDGTWHKWEE